MIIANKSRMTLCCINKEEEEGREEGEGEGGEGEGKEEGEEGGEGEGGEEGEEGGEEKEEEGLNILTCIYKRAIHFKANISVSGMGVRAS